MFSATPMATSASSHSQPVSMTSSRPITTPADVQTSVNRWRASASSAIECVTREARSISQASAPLNTELATDSTRPRPSCSRGRGAHSLGSAAQMMASAAPKISMPSKAEEKYSALWWP